MTTKLFLTFILIHFISSAQIDKYIEKRYYKNGKLNFIAVKHGIDTIEYKGYYKNGQIKDSVWLYISGHQEIPLGTGKTYYKNGNISSIKHYKNGYDEYILYGYRRNGKLERFVQKPTGLTKFYNKKGEQIREYDYHKRMGIYVPKEFRKGRHLVNSSFSKRIQIKKASLMCDNKETKLLSGALISLLFNLDTVPLTHCQIEGFSKDSIFLSQFHYNENYSRGSGLNILKYDSTFAIGFNQLDALYYAKHKDQKRELGALTAMITGVEFVLFSTIAFVFLPFMAAPLIPSICVFTSFEGIGIPLYYYGKYLFKTMVPKKYDMHKAKISVRP